MNVEPQLARTSAESAQLAQAGRRRDPRERRLQEPLTILRERRRVKRLVLEIEVQEPCEEEIVG